MGETREEFINGFCRTTNESRTVCCEYERQPDGEWTLTDYECNVDKCPNSAACQIYKEASLRSMSALSAVPSVLPNSTNKTFRLLAGGRR